MRRAPVYFFGHVGRMRVDGRVVLDMTVYRVKTPAQARDADDLLEPVRLLPGTEAYRPPGASGCRLSP